MKNILFLLLSVTFVHAQKTIVISDDLSENAEKLNVKPGSKGFGKIWKIRFGDYEVVSSKKGWLKESVKGNLFNTKIESKSTEKFSFVLANKSGDTTIVNAANNIVVRALQEIELFLHFSWGNNELLQESHNFSCFIVLNRDTSETWALLMNVTRGSDVESNDEAFLINGDRRILIHPANSQKKGNGFFAQSAAGYEFIENMQSLCALQYLSNMGWDKDIIWIQKDLGPGMKLILASAMTAILELKMGELEN